MESVRYEKTPSQFFNSFGYFLSDIKIAHSVFALPFAASALRFARVDFPSMQQIFLLLIAMVTARSWAMGMNRFIDRSIDKINNRTAQRMIPSGKMSAFHSLGWSLLAGGFFIASAYALNSQAGMLSFPLLLILALYSYTKRFTWLCHWYLGACLGLAPIAVSVALGAPVQPAQLLIGAGVMMWTAGFDIIYALQDMKFDSQQNLRSVPVRFGLKGSLFISRCCFAAMILLLISAGVLQQCDIVYFVGVALLAGIMAYEHWLVRKGDNINQAFFTVNSWVGIIFFVFSQLDAVI
jgi:4-hydroxybenzoate polyprenyltransferase